MYKYEEKQLVKMIKVHDFLSCVYTYEDFVQTQLNFALSDDGETVTFRNSAVYTGVLCRVKYVLYSVHLCQVSS